MHYYNLTKPGIIYGNTITAAAGFLFASRDSIDWLLMFYTLIGFALVTASACVINNILDRDIDARMERTKEREIPSGRISVRHAAIFGSILGLAGTLVLFFATNLVALGVLLFGYCMYLIVYTLAKRRTVYFTYAGALAGAVPPVVGYTAVSGALDTSALLLYAILVFWQMAHFYAISIYRAKEYAVAGIPVLPLQKGLVRTKVEIVLFIGAFAAAFSMLVIPVAPRAGFVILGVSLLWLLYAILGFWTASSGRWARRMFLFSLVVIVLVSFALSLVGFNAFL